MADEDLHHFFFKDTVRELIQLNKKNVADYTFDDPVDLIRQVLDLDFNVLYLYQLHNLAMYNADVLALLLPKLRFDWVDRLQGNRLLSYYMNTDPRGLQLLLDDGYEPILEYMHHLLYDDPDPPECEEILDRWVGPTGKTFEDYSGGQNNPLITAIQTGQPIDTLLVQPAQRQNQALRVALAVPHPVAVRTLLAHPEVMNQLYIDAQQDIAYTRPFQPALNRLLTADIRSTFQSAEGTVIDQIYRKPLAKHVFLSQLSPILQQEPDQCLIPE